MEHMGLVLRKIVDSREYMKKIGFSILELQKAMEQFQKGEELSEEQLDKLADLRFYINPDSWSYLFNEAFNSKLEERVKRKNFVNYSDGTKSEVIKTKYSTYYGVKNGTWTPFVCENLTKGCTEKKRDGYKIQFPKGVWKETQKQKEPDVPRVYTNFYEIQQVVNRIPFKKYSITLPSNGENYFIKIED